MFHSRQHLISWLQDNLSDRVLQNLLQGGGELELLGGFSPLPGSSNPGWIVSLTSYQTGQAHYICIGVCQKTGKIRWWKTKGVEWKNWDGNKTENPLYQGDNPEIYKRWLKNESM
jgi:hypothetical protein